MEEWYAVIFLGIVFIVAVGLLRLISFAVEDIRQQGKGEHLPLPALMMFGLVSFIAWPFIRSKKSPPENIVRVYESSEDAFSDAQRMEALGDWDAALRA